MVYDDCYNHIALKSVQNYLHRITLKYNHQINDNNKWQKVSQIVFVNENN